MLALHPPFFFFSDLSQPRFQVRDKHFSSSGEYTYFSFWAGISSHTFIHWREAVPHIPDWHNTPSRHPSPVSTRTPRSKTDHRSTLCRTGSPRHILHHSHTPWNTGGQWYTLASSFQCGPHWICQMTFSKNACLKLAHFLFLARLKRDTPGKWSWHLCHLPQKDSYLRQKA